MQYRDRKAKHDRLKGCATGEAKNLNGVLSPEFLAMATHEAD
jgi:hypothetical protein